MFQPDADVHLHHSVLRAVYSASHETIVELLACILQVNVIVIVIVIVIQMNITHCFVKSSYTYSLVPLTIVCCRLPLATFSTMIRRFWVSRNIVVYFVKCDV